MKAAATIIIAAAVIAEIATGGPTLAAFGLPGVAAGTWLFLRRGA